MRILIDGRFWGLENAGLGRYTINLVENLAKLDTKNEYCLLLRKTYFNRINLPPNWHPVLAEWQHYSLGEQFHIPKLIFKVKPDLCHFLHFNVPLLINRPFVVTIHDMVMHRSKGLESTTLNPLFYFPKRLGYKLVFAEAVKKAKKIIVPSNFVKREILKEFKINEEKVTVIYEGFNEIFLKAKSSKQPPYFVYAGNAYPHKNLGRLIEAVVFLNEVQNRKVQLVLVSARNVFMQRLEKLIKNKKANKYIKILGFIPDEELAEIYAGSVGFIYPSLFEGFGLQGLETMASGTLLLASDIPIFKEIYKDNAVYFNPFDFSSIARAIETVLTMDEDKRKEIIEKAKNFVQKYSWPQMAQETLKIYEDCLT